MTRFTHWVLFDSAVVVVVDVAAAVGYRSPTHQLPHRPKLLIAEVRASSRCGDPLCRGTILNPATGHHRVMVIRMANVVELPDFLQLWRTMGRHHTGRGAVRSERHGKSNHKAPEDIEGGHRQSAFKYIRKATIQGGCAKTSFEVRHLV